MILNLTYIFLDSGQIFRKVSKKPDTSRQQHFAAFFYKVYAWFSNHVVCKIGLTAVAPGMGCRLLLPQLIGQRFTGEHTVACWLINCRIKKMGEVEKGILQVRTLSL